MTSNFSFRIKIISFFIISIALLITTKLFFIQIIHGEAYTERADREFATPSGDLYERRNIYFSDKSGTKISAATIMSGFKLAVNPGKITDPEGTFGAISKLTPLDHDTFIAKATKQNDPYEEVANRLSKETAEAIDALKLPGIAIYKENWRSYPGDTLAAQTIGFVAYKGDDFSGRYGLERQYNDILSRTTDNLYVNFFAEVFSNVQTTFFKSDTAEGDIVTTIDPVIQDALEKTLRGVIDTWHSDEVGGIIIDPKTGAIYAMASLPSFNLNDFSQVSNPARFANPLVENVFELGSVFKTLTLVSGFDAGVITPKTTYTDKGCIVLNTKTVCNYDRQARGVIPMQEVINHSLNLGAAFVMDKLGEERFRNYFISFGLDQKTGIDLPNEATNIISNLYSPRELEYATASFGQGIAVSPVSAVRAFSVLANGGTLVTPHVGKEIVYKDGGLKELSYPEKPNIISKNATEEMTRMLVTAVDTALFSGKEKLDHYSVAAKTGTAQIALPNGKGYYDDRYLHSMYGYYPAYDPKFLVLLYDIYPKNASYAINTLGIPFMDTAKFLLNYYNVAPDR